jgi:hypothetical protein
MTTYSSGQRRLQDAFEASPYTPTMRRGEGHERARSEGGIKAGIAARPWAALTLATLAGYTLGMLGGSTARRQHVAYATEQRADYPRHQSIDAGSSSGGAQQWLSSLLNEKEQHELSNEWQRLKDALAGSVTGLLRDSLRQGAPGVYQEYERIRSGGEGHERESAHEQGRYRVSSAQPAPDQLNSDAWPPASAV